MNYININDAEPLLVEYEGSPLSAQFVAILHLELQEIIDKSAWLELDHQDVLARFGLPPWYWVRFPFFSGTREPLVRAEIREIKAGSLFETIALLIPAMLAQADVRAVLQNLAASIIFRVGTSGIGGVRFVAGSRHEPVSRRPTPQVDVGSNVRNIVTAMSANGGGRVRLKHKDSQGSITEVDIEVGHPEAK